jgi:sporulation protein YlmC with PRC-barrel domain
MNTNEIHAERLLGRRVRDRNGVVVGRIEEFLIEWIDSEPSVTEYHVGKAGWLERLGGFMLQLPFLSAIRPTPMEYRIPWSMMDLTDSRLPMVLADKRDLHRQPCDS